MTSAIYLLKTVPEESGCIVDTLPPHQGFDYTFLNSSCCRSCRSTDSEAVTGIATLVDPGSDESVPYLSHKLIPCQRASIRKLEQCAGPHPAHDKIAQECRYRAQICVVDTGRLTP